MKRSPGFSILLRYTRPNAWLYVLAMVLQLLSQLGGYAMPIVNMALIDRVILGGESNLLLPLAGVLLASLAVFRGFEAVGSSFVAKAQEQSLVALRRDLFDHVIMLEFSEIAKHGIGHLVSRVYSDANQAISLVGAAAHGLVLNALAVAGACILLLTLDRRLGLATVAVIPVFIGYALLSRDQLTRTARRTQESTAALMQTLQVSLSGILTVRAFGAEHLESVRFNGTQNDLARSRYAQAKVLSLHSVVTSTMMALGQVMAFVLGSVLVVRGEISVGKVVAYTGLLGYAYGPCHKLVSAYLGLQSGFVAANRTAELLQWPREGTPRCGQPLPPWESIRFDHVTYSYPGQSKPALTDISLVIPRGAIVAVIGPSGSGKTTLGYLLMGFAAPQSGAIFAGRTVLERGLLLSLRRICGYVAQEPYLFPGTVADNLSYSRAFSSLSACSQVLQILGDIPPDTPVSEMGSGLSVGQKQRVAIARALAKEPSILILDEPTSALDRESEQLLLEILGQLRGRVTIILFSHKVSTIRGADLIYVLKDGHVEAFGSYDELTQTNDFLQRQVGERGEDELPW